jgi:hypothetical protein
MAIILGSATVVTVDGNSEGIISVNWGISPQVNRLWQIGSWSPFKTMVTSTRTISVTMYAGAGPDLITVTPTESCANSVSTITISIVPAACGASIEGATGTFFLNSYSYDKGDAGGFGQQSYSAQQWVDGDENCEADVVYVRAPTYIISGISEATITADEGLNTGITLLNSSLNVEGEQGSVSAGVPGIGTVNTTIYSIASSIGNGDMCSRGKVGQGSVSIPLTPIYI